MSSIVAELADWTKANAVALTSRGVQVTEKFPEPNSAYPWKAGIGLVYKEIIVSFTVWERSIFQTELIIMNASTRKTIVVDDKTPSDVAHMRADLDSVVQRLLSDFYHEASPDPKLDIS
jgi:hypothetical protein